MIDALARPMIDLLEECGSGMLPEGEHAAALSAGCDGLRTATSLVDRALTAVAPVGSALLSAGTEVLSAAGGAIGSGGGSGWSGPAADTAASAAADAASSAARLAEHGEQLDAVLQQGLQAMQRAAAEIGEVIASFVSSATAAAPALATPAGPAMLITLAIDHLSRATAIIGRLRGELSALTGEVGRLAEPPATPPRPGGGADIAGAALSGVQAAGDLFSTGSRMMSGALESFTGSAGGVSPEGPSAGTASTIGDGGLATGSSDGDTGSSVTIAPGEGVTITLPDGSTATAPNEAAAQAVRSALTQQGVPYQWGGTTPGSGLDCSGLTQWAYGEAGVELPRLAQEQSVGVPVSADGLEPGDLAVWDGHVAMVIGNGQMIEAGDPVSVSAVRTSNSGMAFHGFFRPTS